MKIEVSEKAGSRRESNPGHLWLGHGLCTMTNQNNVVLTQARLTVMKHLPSALGTGGKLWEVCLLHTIIVSDT